MCGITGFWATDAQVEDDARACLEAMTAALRHRGPDDSGQWLGGHSEIGLGHRRLAIVDLSAEGRQPMRSAAGRYVIVFNGEVYNFAALRRELEGFPDCPGFRGTSDTEVMLAAIERWGLEAATQRFIGMFAFALWDREQRKLHLVRDRLGIKPLYYSVGDAGLCFGSELGALREWKAFDSTVNASALASFFRWGYVPGPATIHRGCWKLAPGTIATFDGPSIEPQFKTYWSAEEVALRGQSEPFAGTFEDATDALDSVLSDAVRLRMVADVPLGAFLSGGIDSSLIVALMQSNATSPVRTYSIGNELAGYDESNDALAVARALRTKHTALRVTQAEALEVAPRLGQMFDEPFADSSQIPTFLVSRLARSEVTVALSGDGGDELFAGYNRHLWGPRVARALTLLPEASKRPLARAAHLLSPDVVDRVYSAASPYLPRLRLPGDKLHKLANLLTSSGPREIYDRLCSQWPLESLPVAPGVVPLAARRGLSDRSSFSTQMMFLDLVSYLPDDILTKVDRASMNVGLEARVPLLDHRVVELSWSLPESFKLRSGRGKAPLRSLLARYLPGHDFDKAKMGFGVPVATWLRGPLKAWASDLLAPDAVRATGLLDADRITAAFAEHQRGRNDRSRELWCALMFMSWRAAWR